MRNQARDLVDRQFKRTIRFESAEIETYDRETGKYVLNKAGTDVQQTDVQRSNGTRLSSGNRALILGSSSGDKPMVLGSFPYIV